MANSPSAVYWIGQNGNTYVKTVRGVEDYGKLPGGSTIAGASQIDDPSAPANGSTFTGGGGSGGGNTSSYDQAIDSTNAQINNLTPVLDSAVQNADNAFQTTTNNLLTGKVSADKTYNDNKTSDAQDFNGAKSTIRANTGSTINGIDTILGAHGGGGQAAGGYAALLAGKAGTRQLNDAGTNFGKNEQSLDTGYHNFVDAYDTNVKNAGLQHESDVNTAKASIQTQKANLLQSLASLINERTAATGGSGTAASQPYADEAKSLLTSSALLGAPKTVAPVVPTTYTPPPISSYTTNPTNVTVGGNGATDTSTPFYTTLLNRDKQLQAA